MRAALPALAVVCSCGHPDGSPVSAAHDEPARDAAPAATVAEVAGKPLGMPDVGSYAWRKRPGQSAFRAARKAEEHGDWPGVVTACERALSADPSHLEAAWLLAVGYAKLGKTTEILAPLQTAEAGDFGKWGPPSLELPALQTFGATPAGQAWHRRVDGDRAAYTASLAHSVVVISSGDLYAYEPEPRRWYRLTRTSGAVLGALPAPSTHQIAYVTRAHTKNGPKLGVGIVDLGTGLTTRPAEVGAPAFVVAYNASSTAFWIGSGAPATWRQLDADAKLHPVVATGRPSGHWLDVTGKTARLHRLPDDNSLAGAVRIGRSNRVVSVPSPGLIDGNTIVWSPDRVHLAFVAQLDEHCTPGKQGVAAAAFVVDAATGHASELERASGGLAIDWLSDRRLAIAGDHGVSLVELDTSTRTPLEGATGLGAPRRRPRCTPDVADDTGPDEPDAGD